MSMRLVGVVSFDFTKKLFGLDIGFQFFALGFVGQLDSHFVSYKVHGNEYASELVLSKEIDL